MSAAVYRFYDESGLLLYVGVTQLLPKRLQEHSYSEWHRDIAHIAVEWFDDKSDGLVAEQMAIIEEKPKHNVLVCDVPPNERDTVIGRLTADPFLTYTAVAEEYGVSRERIRQIVPQGLEKSRTAERSRTRLELRLAARAQRALAEDLRCDTCGSWILRRSTSTCSRECREALDILRTFDDPDEHRRSMAQTYLNNPDRYSDVNVEWAKRMLGPNPPEKNRTFLVPGSKRAELIKKYRPEAYAKLLSA
jgi:hypothetical protein